VRPGHGTMGAKELRHRAAEVDLAADLRLLGS
jgi:hypothetical protein